MRISFVQLSDIHFNKAKNNPLLERREKLADAISSKVKGSEICIILITGDVAFSGAVDEYNIALKFFQELFSDLTGKNNNTEFKYFFIPGNHDCDFSTDNNIRNALLQNIEVTKDAPADIESALLSVQQNYFAFIEEWDKDVDQLKNALYKKIRVNFQGSDIELNLINSAWMSTKNEQQGKLLFPPKRISSESASDVSPVLSVTLLHHPYQWFDADNAREIKGVIETMSDIILTGHEHDGGSYKKIHKEQQMEYIEGGVLQGDSRDLCGFNFILVDLFKDEFAVLAFDWHDDDKCFVPSEPLSRAFTRNRYRLRNEYLISGAFNKDLQDPGVNFSHPNKETVFLDDIFVFPQLRQLHLPGDPEWTKTMFHGKAIDFIIQNTHILLMGGDKGGKSSFAKKIFWELHKLNFVPLIISGETIKNVDSTHFITNIKKQFEKEYQSPQYTQYEQLNIEKKVLIIDDYHKCPLNVKGRDELLKQADSLFGRIILIGDEQLRFTDLIGGQDGQHLSFWSYSICEILEFGKLKRKELIERWYSLGNAYTIDETSVKQEVIRVEKVISSLIGNNFVPSYPLFILGMLQQIEIRNPVETTSGSYGYLYESLLTMSLSRNPYKDVDIDTQYSYLAELAYELFLKRVVSLDSGQASEWHIAYCEKYKLAISQDALLDYLCEVAVLKTENGCVSFRYPYIYYYFVARYLRDHITEDEIRQHVQRMSTRLHHTESANIIIFLCYLSKDPVILYNLLNASRKLFAKYDECELLTDTRLISSLIPDVPRIVLEDRDESENHKSLLLAEDELAEKHSSDSDYSEDDGKFDNDLQEIMQINVAFKTIQILGQLLRNFPGSLMGTQKYELAQECYSLGLRVLSFTLKNIQENQQDMVSSIGEILQAKHPRWPYERLNEEVKYLLFSIMEGMAFVMIKHTSDSVGLERLSLTYNDLLNSNDNISYRFIDLSVRLENFKGFPKNETLDLYKAVYKNHFSAQLLRHLVWYYFYIYPAKYDLKKSICDKLGINIQPLHIGQSPKLLNG